MLALQTYAPQTYALQTYALQTKAEYSFPFVVEYVSTTNIIMHALPQFSSLDF